MSAATRDGWANPASVHGAGRAARRYIESAREAVGVLLGFDPRDVILTGGGTEANNLALLGLFTESVLAERSVLITSAIEHPSILRTAERLEARGVTVVRLSAEASGAIDVAELEQALATHGAAVKLVSLQAVNHETGALQPIQEVRRLCDARGVLFHCDAVQHLGRLPTELLHGIDLVTVAAHKLRGPKGVGALAVKCGLKLAPVFGGGAQERGVRPGTQDPVACAGFAAALHRAPAMVERYAGVARLRDLLHEALRELVECELNAGTGARAPHVLNLSFAGWKGPELCAALDLEDVHVSSGSACSAGTAEPSPVITHCFGRDRARSAVRISLGEGTTLEDCTLALQSFRLVLRRNS